MVTSIIAAVARWKWGKKILEWSDKVYSALEGHKSEVIGSVYALVVALDWAGILPQGSAEKANYLLAALPVTMAEKIKRVVKTAGKVVPDKGK